MWTVIVTFCAVVLIIYFSYLFSKYLGNTMNKSTASRYMRLLDQITIGQDRHLAVVQVADKYLLIGITAGQINLLKELEEEELISLKPEETTPGAKPPEFRELIDKLGKFTKKGR